MSTSSGLGTAISTERRLACPKLFARALFQSVGFLHNAARQSFTMGAEPAEQKVFSRPGGTPQPPETRNLEQVLVARAGLWHPMAFGIQMPKTECFYVCCQQDTAFRSFLKVVGLLTACRRQHSASKWMTELMVAVFCIGRKTRHRFNGSHHGAHPP